MNFYTNTNSKPVIIGIDHGYGNIKTAHTCFKTGVAAYDKEPTFTEKYGTHQCMLAVRESLMQRFGTAVDDSVIENVLRFGTADIGEKYLSVIRSTATEYVSGIMRRLREHEYNPELMRLYVMGASPFPTKQALRGPLGGGGIPAATCAHLRAKSRLRRLRSETRLRAQSEADAAPARASRQCHITCGCCCHCLRCSKWSGSK